MAVQMEGTVALEGALQMRWAWVKKMPSTTWGVEGDKGTCESEDAEIAMKTRAGGKKQRTWGESS